MTKEIINYEDFNKLEIKVGTIIEAAAVPDSQKLVKLLVDFKTEKRQILTGMLKWYTPESFVGKQTLFLVNLAPRKMAGLESQGMMLSIGTNHEDTPILIKPEIQAKDGDLIG